MATYVSVVMLHDLRRALTSRRTLAVTLLSFSSGLPLALVWTAIPDWMRSAGVDIRVVGLSTLAQAPWSFKILWSPLMDRYALPWLGRRRGWIAVTQLALCALTLLIGGVGLDPQAPWVLLSLAFALAVVSASHDIVVDAYAVEVLRPEEQGLAVGARTAMYRAAMLVAGGVAIWMASLVSWKLVCAMLAALYLPLLLVTRMAPEPDKGIAAPATLRQAVWLPFLGVLSRHRALEILAFVFCYKLADNLAQSLQRPFLVDMGYSAADRGLAITTVGLIGTVGGTFLGGALTTTFGLGRSLWLFGVLQIFSNLGYVAVSQTAVNRPLMYGAMAFETFTTGLGMGAFFVLLLRLTEKRFSATQYALFSSLFAVPRILAGPITGFVVHAVGWTSFFWFSMLAGIPGMVLLARFVPLGVKEPEFPVEPPRRRAPLSAGALTRRGLVGGVVGFAGALAITVALEALGIYTRDPARGFDLATPLAALLPPAGVAAWIELVGCLVCGVIGGLFTAAVFAARHGQGVEIAAAERPCPNVR
ncbi:MAG TPA: MFS transporter [Candidatus Polarisedimenticolaceae bacterium]|nr:MFS transporter [Candidatus Polarisedimenticolaceae bacterium]